jgi:hypothetical protein
LLDQIFDDAGAVVEAVTYHFDGITFELPQGVLKNWIERANWIVGRIGEYFIK